MKLAVISVTNNGALLANELAEKLSAFNNQVAVFAKNGRNPLDATHYELLSKLIADIFPQYDGLIFIMATGIVVRVIAPYVCDKRIDPAVVVMDDSGKHAISLLSGHLGGANELAELVAKIVGAEPVITTATDVSQKPAADVLARHLDLTIEPFDQLKCINAAIVNGDKVKFFVDTSLPNQRVYLQTALKLDIILEDICQLSCNNYDFAVIISNDIMPVSVPHLYLRTKKIAVGIGCRRGTTSADILFAVTDACNKIGYSISNIAIIGSSIVKQDEVGLLAVIQQLAVPSKFFINEELEECIKKHKLDVSSFVQKQIGVGNVCAAAAILVGQTNKLLLPKTKYKNVTVAIAPVK